MNISDEAVEAAAKAISRSLGLNLTDQARLALEAAAPHMLANAWDEGNIAGVFDLPSEQHATPNPYRSQA
jgi:hypothetical protein